MRRFAFGSMAAALLLTAMPASAATPEANGKISVIYERSADDETDELASAIRDSKIFDELTAGFNETLFLPRDLKVVFQNCGVANAFYDPSRRQIVMCYEMITMFTESSAKGAASDEEVGESLVGTTLFFFLHELGHALVHQLDLPITGREEDAVDQLAAVMLLEGMKEDDSGGLMLAAAAIQFGDLAAKLSAEEDPVFWGEHSLDVQRMYNALCMIYGSDPAKYAAFVGPDKLPKERADRCPKEYQQLSRSWQRLMEPYVRPDDEAPKAS